MPYTFRPYSKLNPTVRATLQTEESAYKALQSWSPTAGKLFANVEGKLFISMDRLHKICQESKQNLHNRLANNIEIFDRLGLSYVYDEDSSRLEVAAALSLYGYCRATSFMYLFTPRCVVAMLLSSNTEQGVSFRTSLDDWGPKKTYFLKKLNLTLTT